VNDFLKKVRFHVTIIRRKGAFYTLEKCGEAPDLCGLSAGELCPRSEGNNQERDDNGYELVRSGGGGGVREGLSKRSGRRHENNNHTRGGRASEIGLINLAKEKGTGDVRADPRGVQNTREGFLLLFRTWGERDTGKWQLKGKKR